MFDLEKEIKNWRSNFLSGKKLSNNVIDELESHLRDSFDDLSQTLSEEEAFAKSLGLLGNREGITSEFRKNAQLSLWDHLVLRGGRFFMGLLV